MHTLSAVFLLQYNFEAHAGYASRGEAMAFCERPRMQHMFGIIAQLGIYL